MSTDAGAPRTASGSRTLGPRRELEEVLGASLPDLGHRVQEDVLRDGPGIRLVPVAAPAAVRGAALRLHEDIQARLERAALSGDAAHEHRPLRILLGGDGDFVDVGREPGGGGAKDAVSSPGHPAVRGGHQPLQPRSQPVVVVIFLLAFGVTPQWTWFLFPFVILALFVFATAVSMLLSSLYVALPRHGDHLVGGLHGALLRDPGALSDREGAEPVPRSDPAQPAHAAVRADAQVGDRSGRAWGGQCGRRLDPSAAGVRASSLASASWAPGTSIGRRRGSRRSSDVSRPSRSAMAREIRWR